DANIREYTRMLEAEESKFLALFKENIALFESLSETDISKLMSNIDMEYKDLSQEDRVLRLAYLKAVDFMKSSLLDIKLIYQEAHDIIDFKIIPVYDYIEGEEQIKESIPLFDKVNPKEKIYLVLETEPEGGGMIWSSYKAIEYKGQNLGYIGITVKALDANQLVSMTTPLNKSLYYVGGNLYSENDFSEELQEKFMNLSYEDVAQLLKDLGYHINRYVFETGNIEMIYYESKSALTRSILDETVSLFEFSTILLVSLFLLVSYTLFIVIIRPCYLLVEYVEQCGEGNYSIPPYLNSIWRSSFLMVRDAYLEKERLLKVKDHQSQELEFAWQRALVASQAKTLFLAKVSHELKTPLNAIKGYIQLLKLKIEQPKQRKQLEVIEHSSNLLLKQVNQLLDLSMIEDGKVKLSIEKFDIFQMASSLAELFYVDTANKGIEFKVETDENIPNELYGDEGRIQQIIINLISNAIKFTEKGGIIVTLDLDYQNETDVYLIIKVQDTGKGIASNKLECIFEPFIQENNTISRQFGGTGLGLSISKCLAEAMGGRLTVESTVDVGSTFTLFLPLSKDEPSLALGDS
ncbi:MAG: HAMP domain-containing histidine kinase, partial [Turicibacter sp.]|nr:HAMP domain-containing histidine kinase [Turicibacter sp.]